MKIYVSHSRDFDFRAELYKLLRDSELNQKHEFILPHEASDEPYPSRKLLLERGCDLVFAEVSFPSTGQGIELGWANSSDVKIICCYKEGSKISASLKVVAENFFAYQDYADLIFKLSKYLSR